MTKKPVKKKAKRAINKLFPGRKGYRGPKSGYFTMVHHEDLFERSDNIMERVDYVTYQKDPSEVATRLHNLMFISKEHPDRKVVLALLKEHIPDHAWSVKRGEMKFPKA